MPYKDIEMRRQYNKQHYQNNKEIIKIYAKKYYRENRDKIREQNKRYHGENKDYRNKQRRIRWNIYYNNNIEKERQRKKLYYQNNKEKFRKQDSIYRKKNHDKIKERHRTWYQANKTEINKKRLTRRHSDVSLRFRFNTSALIREKLKRRLSSKNGKSTFGFLPYTINDLTQHLESQFQPGMTWQNYGFYGWHIDHIRPDSSFHYTSIEDEEFQRCWALENLQPLWAEENWKKSNLLNRAENLQR